MSSIVELFRVDMLSILMISLVGFIGSQVCLFSSRYMQGDSQYRHFYQNMFLLLSSVILITTADNLILFFMAWTYCNLILSKLMIHKSSWEAAKASGHLVIKNYLWGGSCLALAFVILFVVTGSLSIGQIVQYSGDSGYITIALTLLVIGAMAQSAIWPFHRWLLSSLNSPTPVSAMMHAGIVNGGGFLLARFAPLFFNHPGILNIIFMVGVISALMGSLWKLMQHDVKRMLACSTLGQMGFMFVQIGLGFFASGIAHLIWHGMFKAYLFLSSGSAAQEKRLPASASLNTSGIILALICGAYGCFVYAMITQVYSLSFDTTLIIFEILFITGTQMALSVLHGHSFKGFVTALLLTTAMATLYGVNVYYSDQWLLPLDMMQPQALGVMHVIFAILLAVSWLCTLFYKENKSKVAPPNWILQLYVKALNASQPDPKTVTCYRKGYDYV